MEKEVPRIKTGEIFTYLYSEKNNIYCSILIFRDFYGKVIKLEAFGNTEEESKENVLNSIKYIKLQFKDFEETGSVDLFKILNDNFTK